MCKNSKEHTHLLAGHSVWGGV